jgi:hypothetical protein
MSYSERIATIESSILEKMVLLNKAKALCILTDYRDDKVCRATISVQNTIEDLRKQLRVCEHIVAKYGLA